MTTTCSRCNIRPATGTTVALSGGRMLAIPACDVCRASIDRTRAFVAGGVAIAALAASIGAAALAARRSLDENAESPAQSSRGAAVPPAAAYRTPTLNAVSRDLTQLAAEGRLDPVIGREAEIERVVRILARRTKNNPVLIGDSATTFDDYRRHIEHDAALERRFQPVIVEEPTAAECRTMLGGLRKRYERHHRVRIDDDAIDAAVRLSARFIPDRRLPDKAFDLLDEGAAMVAMRGGDTLGADDIARVVSGWTGVPVETLTADQAAGLLELEQRLGRRIVGQGAAVRAIAECVRQSRAGLRRERGPAGALLFAGPSGVGKTELARATAEALFGSDDALLRFDMSEFGSSASVARLIGSPPGYAGSDRAGDLTEAVRRRPYAVVLFDDVDRADAAVADLMLQVLDDGRLTDASGRSADFRNAFVILTMNLAPGADPSSIGSLLSAEIVNRLDDAVVFASLGLRELRAIAEREVAPLIAAAAAQGVELHVEGSAFDAIAREADDPRQGARQLRRIVERRLRAPLSNALVSGELTRGHAVRAQAREDGSIEIVRCDS